MRLKVKRAHMPYPGVRFAHGMELVLEPDWLAKELIKRGWYEEDTSPIESSEMMEMEAPKKPGGKRKAPASSPKLDLE